MLVNEAFREVFPSMEVQHLCRQGVDHAPLHLTCKSDVGNMVRMFRFLNFWCNHKGFADVVEQNWKVDCYGNVFLEF